MCLMSFLLLPTDLKLPHKKKGWGWERTYIEERKKKKTISTKFCEIDARLAFFLSSTVWLLVAFFFVHRIPFPYDALWCFGEGVYVFFPSLIIAIRFVFCRRVLVVRQRYSSPVGSPQGNNTVLLVTSIDKTMLLFFFFLFFPFSLSLLELSARICMTWLVLFPFLMLLFFSHTQVHVEFLLVVRRRS